MTEFYFTVTDYYQNPMTNPTTPYNSISEAIIEAKNYLVTRNISDGYHIIVHDASPEERVAIAFRGDLPPLPVYSEFITRGEIEAYGGVEPRYTNFIMEEVRKHLGLESGDTSRDREINDMSHNEVFRHCLEWEGIIGYDYKIRVWVKEIYGVELS